MTTAFFVVLLGAAVLAWLFRPPSRRRAVEDPVFGDRDEAELAAAEREVQSLDALATPDDAEDDLPDWGPGAPRD